MRRARAAERQGNREQALALYHAILSRFPDSSEAPQAQIDALELAASLQAADASVAPPEPGFPGTVPVSPTIDAPRQPARINDQEITATQQDLAAPAPPVDAESDSDIRDILNTSLAKVLRGWGTALIAIGFLHFLLDFLEPGWGLILILLGIINFAVRSKWILLLNGLLLCVAGAGNIAVAMSAWGGDRLALFGAFQLFLGVRQMILIRQYTVKALKQQLSASEMKICVYCGAGVDEKASVCPYCNGSFSRESMLANGVDAKTAAAEVLRTLGVRGLHEFGNGGMTPLMEYAARGDQQTVELLLSAGASRWQTDREGYTAVEIARKAGHPDVANFIDSYTLLNRNSD